MKNSPILLHLACLAVALGTSQYEKIPFFTRGLIRSLW